MSVTDQISDTMADNLVDRFPRVSSDELNLYLDTNGGDVYAAIKIMEGITQLVSRNITVNCIADKAESAGFIIFQHCPNRFITKNSGVMQHNMKVELEGDIQYAYKELLGIMELEKQLVNMQTNRIGITETQFREDIGNDLTLYSNDILQYGSRGVADKMVTLKCYPYYLVNPTSKKLTVTYHHCPPELVPLFV